MGFVYTRSMARDPLELLSAATGFEWDVANAQKLWDRHRVSWLEAEQALMNRSLVVPDPEHSLRELRFVALGKTDDARPLFLVFTIRANRIRVISARDMNRKERGAYGKDAEAPEEDSGLSE